MSRLINCLIKDGYLKSPAIIRAFKKISRADFAPEELVRKKGREFIEEHNTPLSIGFNQTVSQPLTVAFMLEQLQPKKGDRVLDIGSGSGWQTALLAEIIGPDGFVYAVERIRKLKDFGERNVAKYGFKNTQFIIGDGTKGLSDQAPFARIIAAAAGEEIPAVWKKQLEIGGRLVAPVENSIYLLIKKSEGKFEKREYPGFAFVPLIEGVKKSIKRVLP